MADTVGVKTTVKEFDNLAAPFSKDMEALFNIIQDDVDRLVRKGIREGWTPEELIREVEKLI